MENNEMGLLFHTFFMEEEKIRAFHIPEDEENIGKIARILGIGLVEFCEKPGMEAMKNGKRLRSEIFFQTEEFQKNYQVTLSVLASRQ